jgi:hypothetical protein
MVNQVLVMPAMDRVTNSSETAADHSEKQPIPNRRNSMHWNGVPKKFDPKATRTFRNR